MSEDQLFLFGFLAVCLIGFITWGLVLPVLAAQKRVRNRIREIIGEGGARLGANATVDAANNRKRQVAESLKVIDERRKAQEKVTLRMRLERAGLEMEPRNFWIASAVCGAVMTIAVFIAAPELNPLVTIMIGFVGTFGVPRFVVNFLVKRRQKKFLDNFANSIDIIVRGVKSGLPLNECLNIIAREAADPINTEFKTVVDQQRLGVPLQECFDRMMARVPLAEVRFFGIVIAIQQQAGGNLSEALGNLSSVLRDRKRMTQRVKALSAEATASAAVLASLPFMVTLLVYVTTPAYISLLFQKSFGNFLLLCSLFWMSCGLFVMKKMINFKY